MLRCNEQHEAANAEIFTSLDALERYLSARLTPPASTRNGPSEVQLEDEMHTGLHAAETLLTNQMDSAMDLLTSWTFRNAFTVGEAGSSIVLVRPPPLTSTALLIPVCGSKQSFHGSLTVSSLLFVSGVMGSRTTKGWIFCGGSSSLISLGANARWTARSSPSATK